MAAITTEQKTHAVKLFVRWAFKDKKKTATCDVVLAADAMQSIDDWFEDAPGGAGASRAVSLNQALPAAFKTATDNDDKAVALAAWAWAKYVWQGS